MAKDKLTEYSATNASNDVIGDISVAEGMLPSAVNNALREQMTHLKNFSDGTDGIDVLSLDDDDASASIKIQAPSAVTTTTTLTLPDGDGDAGAMLQTNGSGQLAWSTAYRNSNLIINGSQIIAQRATSATGKTASGYYTCDRWQQLISSAGTWTFTQDTSVPSGEGFAYSYKWDCTTADGSLASGDYLIHRQNIEGQNLQQLSYGVSGAKSVTLSFWVKSNKTGTYVCELRKGDDAKHIGRTYAISSANTWEYKTVTFTGDTASALVNTNATGIKVHFWLAAGSSYTSGTLPASWASNTTANQAVGQTVNLADSTSNEWLITGVQLEIGEQATPFEHRSYGDELAACQRYYEELPPSFFDQEESVSSAGFGIRRVVTYKVTKRTAPTITAPNRSSFELANADSFNSQVEGVTRTYSSSGSGNAYVLYNTNLKADAEL